MTGRTRRRASGGRGALLVALIAVVALPGCWLQTGGGPGHTRYQAFDGGLTTANVDTLHELWSVEVPGSPTEPMVSEGRVFVTHSNTYSTGVRAFDANTGATLWNAALTAVPAVSGAFAGGAPVTFVGDELWSGFLAYVPFAPGGGTPACNLATSVIDPDTGAVSSGGFAFPSAAVSSGPVWARVLLSVSSPRPCSLSNPTITLEVGGAPGGGWTTTIPATLSTVVSTPTLTSDRVLLAHGASLDSYAIGGCLPDCLRWTRTLSPEPRDPVVEGSGPIFVTTGGTLLALDQADGATLWRAPLAGTLSSSAAVANGTVYVTSLAASGAGVVLRAFDADGCGATTCEPLWDASFDGDAFGAPVVGGGVVYVADGDSVVAVDASGCGATNCEPLADVAVPDSGRLVLSDGRLFLATDGRLTALGPE